MHEHRIATNGIELNVVEEGSGPLVILLHGWPEIAYSWRYQIPALAAAGYRVMAPDMRGFGWSDCPPAVSDYSSDIVINDIVGLIEHAGEEQAVIVGHDWGSLITWDMCLTRPERVRAAVPMSVAFFRPPIPPTELFEAVSGGGFFYILYFQKEGVAEEELEADARLTMASILWSASGDAQPETAPAPLPREGTRFLDQMRAQPGGGLPAWLTEADLDKYTAAFERSGFRGGLNYYRSMDGNWRRTHEISLEVASMPIGFIAGAKDPVIRLAGTDAMAEQFADFRGSTLVPGAGHWNQQEGAAGTTAALLEFLRGL